MVRKRGNPPWRLRNVWLCSSFTAKWTRTHGWRNTILSRWRYITMPSSRQRNRYYSSIIYKKVYGSKEQSAIRRDRASDGRLLWVSPSPRDGQGAAGLVQQTGRRDASLLQQYGWHPTRIGHCQYAW